MSGNQTRTNQGGSVASFIIGGVILAVILVGGVYLLQKRGASPSNAPVASNGASPSVNPSSPSPSASPSSTPKASPLTQQPPTASVPNGTTPLPATGPSDYMPTGIVLAILTAITVSYLRSKRDTAKAASQVD